MGEQRQPMTDKLMSTGTEVLKTVPMVGVSWRLSRLAVKHGVRVGDISARTAVAVGRKLMPANNPDHLSRRLNSHEEADLGRAALAEKRIAEDLAKLRPIPPAAAVHDDDPMAGFKQQLGYDSTYAEPEYVAQLKQNRDQGIGLSQEQETAVIMDEMQQPSASQQSSANA